MALTAYTLPSQVERGKQDHIAYPSWSGRLDFIMIVSDNEEGYFLSDPRLRAEYH